jgi:hypothetical protein
MEHVFSVNKNTYLLFFENNKNTYCIRPFELLEIDIGEHFLILNSYYNQTDSFRCGFGTVNL